jgi:TorA-specific chaperone
VTARPPQTLRAQDDGAAAPAPASPGALGAAERAAVYQWLAGLFAAEPTVDALMVYRTAEGAALLQDLREIEALAPVADEVADWIRHASVADLRVIARDLAGEFAFLFHGAGGRRSAPPCKSFYVSATGRMMQEPAADMAQRLRQLDLRRDGGFVEPPDHIAVQLAVMARLATTAPPAEQAAYLADQITDWLDAFAARCARGTPYGFFAVAAAATRDFARADARDLGA